MTMYNATVDLELANPGEERALELAEKLQAYHPAVGTSPTGWLSATISYPAESLPQAIATALSVVEAAAGVQAIAIEVMTEKEFDKQQGFVHVPDLMSTTQFAELMGLSRMRVNQMVQEGDKLLTTQKVGGSYVIAASEGIAKAKAAGRDVSAWEPGIGGADQ